VDGGKCGGNNNPKKKSNYKKRTTGPNRGARGLVFTKTGAFSKGVPHPTKSGKNQGKVGEKGKTGFVPSVSDPIGEVDLGGGTRKNPTFGLTGGGLILGFPSPPPPWGPANGGPAAIKSQRPGG